LRGNKSRVLSRKWRSKLCGGISFEMAKALVINYPDTAIKVAKMILAYKELDANDIRVKVE
jgi:hypothetical protein